MQECEDHSTAQHRRGTRGDEEGGKFGLQTGHSPKVAGPADIRPLPAAHRRFGVSRSFGFLASISTRARDAAVLNRRGHAWYAVEPPTTVRTIWMSLILSLSTVKRSSDSTTKSASLPGVIDPLIASSCEL